MSSLAITAAGAWLWDKYGETVTNKAADAVKGRWKKFKWKGASEEYRKKIKKLYGTMQIMGMAESVPLDDIFTDAYMLDKPTAFGRFDIEHLKQMSADQDATPPQAKRINGLRLVVEKERLVVEDEGGIRGKRGSIIEQAKNLLVPGNLHASKRRLIIEKDRNLFILGKPGAGKTTFLKYIAVKAAEQIVDKVPIFVSLKEWADSGSELFSFIAERFDICDFPDAQPFVKELLKSGRAIVLFDGLDEVNQESGQRDKQTRAMSNFIEKYDGAQCLITCRIAANDYSFKPFTYVEIADFTERQIQKFVGNWFHNYKETRDKFLVEFAKGDNKGLRDLARTPLLLTLLCLAFNETLTFPQRRVEIYEESLDALLKKWDSSRSIKRDEVYRKLSLGHKENMMSRIAAETFEKNEYFILRQELERYITDFVKNIPPHDTTEAADGEAILKAIEAQHGIFVERARDVYSFSHLTFQEYFTAKYIVDNAAKGTLTSLVKAHYTDGRWREVFLLTTSLLPDASEFMTTFRHNVDDLLGGDGKLKALLEWADKKSASIHIGSWLARANYLLVELYYSGGGRALNLALNHALTRNLDRDRAHSLTRALDLAYALTRDRTPARGLEFNEIAEELAALLIPTDEATFAGRQEFAEELRALIIKHRNIGYKLTLTEIQEERLTDYLNAINLLQDCLELAFMTPEEKKAMLSSLYLPLAQAEDGQNA